MKLVCAVTIAVLLTAHAARADECADAVVDYNAVLSRLNDAMQHYSSCVADSKGTDKCSGAFARLRRAHEEYEAAVAVYIKQCL